MDEWDEALERRMELTQFKAGDVLTAENVIEVQTLFDELEEEVRAHADAYDRGLQDGRLAAGGADIAALLLKVDELRTEVVIEKSLSRFYRATPSTGPCPACGARRDANGVGEHASDCQLYGDSAPLKVTAPSSAEQVAGDSSRDTQNPSDLLTEHKTRSV